MIKTNAYSDHLADALRAVAEIQNPNFTTAPIDPTDEMLEAAMEGADISREQARDMYMSMLLAWSKAN